MAKKPEPKKQTAKTEQKPSGKISKDEQLGFHKGSLSTLAKERQELGRILNIVEQLMQMHAAALKDLGVDLEKEMQGMVPQQGSQQAPPVKKKPPIEDIL